MALREFVWVEGESSAWERGVAGWSVGIPHCAWAQEKVGHIWHLALSCYLRRWSGEEAPMPKVEVDVNLEQLAVVLTSLSQGEQETLALLLDRDTTEEILKRRALAEQSRRAGTLLTAEDLLTE